MESGSRSERIGWDRMKLDRELAGARVYLRDYRPDDLDFATGMWLDGENGRYLSDPAWDYVDAPFQRALDTLQDSPLGYYLTACQRDGERIGTCCVFPDEGREGYDIGYCVHKSRWGQGFGMEIVGLLTAWVRTQGGRWVTAEVADDNHPSRRVLEACGFTMGRATEFEKYHMGVRYKSHIYQLPLPPEIALGERTAGTTAYSFTKMNTEAIRKTLPMRAQTVEEAVADFHASQRPGASSFGRTILMDGRHVGDVWCYGIDPAGMPNAMVGYCVFEQPLWGQGAASKALALFLPDIAQKYGLKTVGAFTFSENLPSIRVLEKNSFCLAEEFVEGGVPSRYYQLDLEQKKV